MALTKKELRELLKLEYSEENESRVLKALEDMEDNEDNTTVELNERLNTYNNLKLVVDNNKRAPKQLKTRLNILNDEIDGTKRLLNRWIKPTVRDLNNKYLQFMEVKYESQIKKYSKEIEKEDKKNSGK